MKKIISVVMLAGFLVASFFWNDSAEGISLFHSKAVPLEKRVLTKVDTPSAHQYSISNGTPVVYAVMVVLYVVNKVQSDKKLKKVLTKESFNKLDASKLRRLRQ